MAIAIAIAFLGPSMAPPTIPGIHQRSTELGILYAVDRALHSRIYPCV